MCEIYSSLSVPALFTYAAANSSLCIRCPPPSVHLAAKEPSIATSLTSSLPSFLLSFFLRLFQLLPFFSSAKVSLGAANLITDRARRSWATFRTWLKSRKEGGNMNGRAMSRLSECQMYGQKFVNKITQLPSVSAHSCQMYARKLCGHPGICERTFA